MWEQKTELHIEWEKRKRKREREAKGENKSDDENDQMSGLLCAQCQLLSPREKKKTVSKKCNTDKAWNKMTLKSKFHLKRDLAEAAKLCVENGQWCPRITPIRCWAHGGKKPRRKSAWNHAIRTK